MYCWVTDVCLGIHQGSASSFLMIALVTDLLTDEVKQEAPWTVMFGDDVVIYSESRRQVRNLERWMFD